jgi:O-antigen/teichoic acid export membrane protein
VFNTLIRNTAISAFAYFVISILGIWTTGALASTYGLAAFGMITLARLFTATGLVGVFDLGAPENASHVIARARSTGNWSEAWRSVQCLLLFVLMTSALCMVVILLFFRVIGVWFGIEQASAEMFGHTLVVSALVLPLCLTAQIAEGVIRGFERYAVARGLDVATSVAYAIGCWVIISQGESYLWVIYLYIIIASVRAVAAYGCAWRILKPHVISADKQDAGGAWRSVLERTRVVAPNKMLTTLQTQSIPLVVGLTVGAAGAGIYDLLMRFPRFAKSTLGLLNSAVLPFASRLEASNSQGSLRTLYERGLLVIAFLSAPPLFALAAFSEPLLYFWVGDALAHYWMWQSFAFSTPLVTVIIGFASLSMFSRTSVISIMTLMVALRLFIQYGIAFLLIGKIGERAFILGATLAVLITAIWELKMLLSLQQVGITVKRHLVSLFALCAALAVLVLPATAYITSIMSLLLALATFSLLSWAMIWIMVIPKEFQERLVSNLKNSFFS